MRLIKLCVADHISVIDLDTIFCVTRTDTKEIMEILFVESTKSLVSITLKAPIDAVIQALEDGLQEGSLL